MSISISKEEVIEEAGCDPWEAEEGFRLETEVENIESLARIFRNGAGEAEDSAAVAEYAASLEEQAGARGSTAIYEDASEHLVQTHEDLDPGGLDRVSRILGEVAAEADSAVENNDVDITGEQGADFLVESYSTMAQVNYDSACEEISEMMSATPGVRSLYFTIYEGTEHAQTFYGSTDSFPYDAVGEGIKQVCLAECADSVTTIHDRIEMRIEDYYSLLRVKEDDLASEGYNVHDSPVGFWYTEGRAEYEAEQLQEVLQGDNPNPATLAKYTAGIESIMGRLEADGGSLTAAESSFLHAYYDTLSGDDLAAIGHLGGSKYLSTQQAIANGVSLAWESNPSSIEEFLSAAPLAGDTSGEFVESVEKFNGFGSLMEHVDHEKFPIAGDFAHALVDTALDAQEWWEGYTLGDDMGTSLDGAPKLLSLAAENAETATEILGEEENANRIMALDWADDGIGAGDVVRAGAIPAEGSEPTAAQAAAAKNVILATTDNPEWISGRNGAPLQRAVSDVGIQYLDSLSGVGDDDGTRKDIFGNQLHGFTLTAGERMDFLQYMARADEEVQVEFAGGVAGYTYHQAHSAFESGSDSAQRIMLRRTGELNGALEAAMLDYQYELSNSRDVAAQQVDRLWRTGASAGISAVSTATTGPIALYANWAGVGNSLVNGLFPAPEPTAPAEYEAGQYLSELQEGSASRHVIVQAAIDAGNSEAAAVAGDWDLPDVKAPEEVLEVNYSDPDVRDAIIAAENWNMQPFTSVRSAELDRSPNFNSDILEDVQERREN